VRILRLSLENWRGVESRDVTLSDGVTVIEGPNEIGKSTIAEAIRLLFSELDSSKKQAVKSIKPVDKDVGSTIEAEIQSGDYHFIYSKTFNKSSKTTLNILAPAKKQLTGREAHEQAEQILGSTVDMALWEALLVDQGEKVALANIRDSAGLAKALDEAAGSSSSGGEDTGLYASVQAEYERYFTLKTGKPKFSAEENAFEKAQSAFDEAKKAVLDVEEDSQSRDRCAAEVRRLRLKLPDLKSRMDELDKQWASIKSLKEKLDAKQKELVAAEAMQKAATDAEADRRTLVEEIGLAAKRLRDAIESQEPLRLKAVKLKDRSDKAQLVIADLKKKRVAAKNALELAQSDERHLGNLEALAEERNRLEQLQTISKQMKTALKIVGSIKINDSALEEFREAERALDIANSKIDAVATTVSVTAEKALDIQFDGDAVSLSKSGVETRSVASELRIRLPGIATVELLPSKSVADVQEDVAEAQAAFTELQNRFGVSDLKEAVAANEQRVTAQREVDRLKEREAGILNGASQEEIEQSIMSYQSDCEAYAENRRSNEELAASATDASSRVHEAKELLGSREDALDAAREKADGLQSEYTQVDGGLRIAQQEMAGVEAALNEKRERLTKARAAEADGVLAERARQAQSAVRTLKEETATIQASFTESSPESVEELLSNAKDVFDRANTNLRQEEQNLAVLADRLQQAQADGRFEAMEAAARELEHREDTLKSMRRRAAAVQLLWNKLNEYRDAARQAYVMPLKEAIERLGKIVFGAGFEVEIGDDWSLLSRTLHGKTLPFDDLSVGAKEQLGILTRLAAAQIVSKQGGVPLIIDDALGFSDPSSLEKMGAAIAAAGRQCQIIILTCTPGRFMHVGSAEVVRF
jgi:DNA repair exonuclease SbcCD ATPase subunit